MTFRTAPRRSWPRSGARPRLSVAAAPEAAIIERDCPACGSSDASPRPQYSREPWHVVACERCSFVYLRNVPDYSRLVEEFAWEKTWAAEQVRRRSERPVFRALDKAAAFRWSIKPDVDGRMRRIFGPGRVLDIGCGRGDSLPEPLVPFGIELSAGLHAEADPKFRARGGYVVLGPAIDKLAHFDEGFFDGVLMSSILEHEMNPKALLGGVRRVLKDGGRLYLKLPNFGSSNRRVMGGKWCGFRYPDHVNYFTVRQVAEMARETGYAFAQIKRFSPFNDNMHAVLTKAG
jgi:SAM-dependent methyltransferase